MGHLHHYSGAVARFRVGSLGAAVHEMLEHLEPLLHEPVALDAVDVYEQPYAACVVFMPRIVKSRPFR